MQRCRNTGRNRGRRLLPVAAIQDRSLAMMFGLPRREVQHGFTFRVIGPSLIDCSVRFGKARGCFAPKVEQGRVLLFAATVNGSVKRYRYKIRQRLHGLVAIRNTEAKSSQKVVRAAMCISAAMLKSQRNLEASSF